MVSSQPENDLAGDQRPRFSRTTSKTRDHGPRPRDLYPGDHGSWRRVFPSASDPRFSSGVGGGTCKRSFEDPTDKDKPKMTKPDPFDAAVNPGKFRRTAVSTADGEVVGIVTAIYNPTGQHVFAGMAFGRADRERRGGWATIRYSKKGFGKMAAARMRDWSDLLYEVTKIVVGQDHFLERVLVALLAGGHLLVEGVPGLAKTLTVATLSRAMRGSFKRIQFTTRPGAGRPDRNTRLQSEKW